MKRLCIMFLVSFCILSIWACSGEISNEDSSEIMSLISSALSESNETSVLIERDANYIDIYDVYHILPMDNEFRECMIHNPIDQIECELFEKAVTTAEMVKATERISNLWEDEMYYAIELFLLDLPKERQEEFRNAQNIWEEGIAVNFEFDVAILMDGSTELLYLMHYAKLERYRERTYKIKYLHYLLEMNLLKENYQSITFKTTR